LISSHQEAFSKNDETEKRFNVAVKKEKLIACTPTRTRLVTGKKTPPLKAASVKEGTVKKGQGGTLWISTIKNGKYKWVQYFEETHEGKERKTTKRKAPSGKAKEFKEGTVMEGEDGNEWIVKKSKTGTFRWVKYVEE